MIKAPIKLPSYLKAAVLLVGLYVFVDILYIAQDIIVPLIFATMGAIMLSPVVGFLVRKKVPRVLAVSLVITLAFLIVGGLMVLLSMQATNYTEAWPEVLDKSKQLFSQCMGWLNRNLHINTSQTDQWVAKAKDQIISMGGSQLGDTLTKLGGLLSTIFLIPVYIFMMLYYQPHLVEFVHRLFGADNDNRVNEMLTETKGIIRSYLMGLSLEFVMVAVLNSLGLLLLGIEYAVLLGVLGALLNVIPYIGGLISVILFMITAMATKTPIYALYVVILYSVIQFIDNNYIVPKVIGSKVQLNALVCLVIVIIGDSLWGVPGMFLSIPLSAIVKLIFDRVDSLKPWGFLLAEMEDGSTKKNEK